MKPRIKLRDEGNCYVGEIDMPLHGGSRHRVSTLGWNPIDTLKQAASQAKQIITNPALAPLIPPQVHAAVKAADAISRLAKKSPELAKKAAASMSPAARALTLAVLKKQPKKPPMRMPSKPTTKPASVLVPGRSSRSFTVKPAASTMPPPTPAPAHGIPSPSNVNFPFNPLDPNEAYAMAAWGAENFAEQEGFQPPVDEFEGVEYDDGTEPEGEQTVYQEDVWDDEES